MVCVEKTKSVDGQTGMVPPLRAVRIAQGLSLREAARRAEVNPAHLSRVERGERQLSVESLGRLARVLGLLELARLLDPYADRRSA
jgi:transcriptional regulator with XRE-family HTH domain